MSAIKYSEALEIAYPKLCEELHKAKSQLALLEGDSLAELVAENAELRAELDYHEKYLLSGDGIRCEHCGKVRHVDHCILIMRGVETEHACCELCARRIRDLDAKESYEAQRQNDLDLWRNK